MLGINLLPTKFTPKTATVQLVKSLRLINIVATVVFFLLIIGFFSLYVSNTSQIKNLSSKIDNLKSTVKGLEAVEQKYVLVKDRARLGLEILTLGSALTDVKKLETLLASWSAVDTEQINIVKKKTEVSVTISDLKTFSEVIKSFYSLNLYDKVILNSFGNQKGGGYTFNLDLTRI